MPEVSARRADGRGDLFSSQTFSELKFCAGDRRCFFKEKCEEESGGQMLLHVQLWYLFAKDSYSYYVTVVWSCNVALWDISLYLVE